MVEGEIPTVSRMDKGLTSKIHKGFLYISKNETSTLIENMNGRFPKEGMQKVNKQAKRCFISKSKQAN